jgi:hypothetical protein
MNTDPGWGSPTESQSPGPYYPAPPAPQYPAGSYVPPNEGAYVPPPPEPGPQQPYYVPPPPTQGAQPPYPAYSPYASVPPVGYPGYYAGPMPPSTNGLAIASLICSIASFVVLPFVGGVLGVVLGHVALSQINQSEGREQGRGMAIAGLIIGYANLALSLIVIALVIVAIIAAANGPQPAGLLMPTSLA